MQRAARSLHNGKPEQERSTAKSKDNARMQHAMQIPKAVNNGLPGRDAHKMKESKR